MSWENWRSVAEWTAEVRNIVIVVHLPPIGGWDVVAPRRYKEDFEKMKDWEDVNKLEAELREAIRGEKEPVQKIIFLSRRDGGHYRPFLEKSKLGPGSWLMEEIPAPDGDRDYWNWKQGEPLPQKWPGPIDPREAAEVEDVAARTGTSSVPDPKDVYISDLDFWDPTPVPHLPHAVVSPQPLFAAKSTPQEDAGTCGDRQLVE